MTKGLMGRAVDGFKGGLAVTLGEAVAPAVVNLIPTASFPSLANVYVNAGLRAAVGLFTAPLLQRMLGPKWTAAYLYGTFASAIKNPVAQLGIPLLSPALLSAYPGGLFALPTRPGSTSSLAATFDYGTLEAEEQQVM